MPDPKPHCLEVQPVPWRVQDYLSTQNGYAPASLDFVSSDDGDDNERFVLNAQAY